MNNPLKFTDPSGNHPILIGIAIAAILHVGTALIFYQPLKFGGLFQAVVLGALTSAATFGIGEMTEAIKSLATKVLVQAAAHGAWQGTFAAIQGGDFWQGAAAGVLSSLASSAWQGGQNRIIDACGGESVSNYQGLGNMLGISGSASMITFGTIMGGVGAALTGGNFWQGAATGLVVC